MTPEEIADKKKKDAEVTAAEAKQKADDDAAAEAKRIADAAADPQDPIKEELGRIEKKKPQYTKLEKALFAKKKIEEEIKNLGGEVDEDPDDEDDDDNEPVTRGDLKKMEKEKAITTAISLATQQITDENELKLTLHHLSNTIKPSGDANEDLRNARLMVNSVKNGQIIDEIKRKEDPVNHSKGTGSPGNHSKPFVPTPDEAALMKPPFNLSQEEVEKARKAEEK